MAKFNIDNYEFINISEGTENNVENLSANELEEMVADTLDVLKATKGKLKKTPTNLCLVAGILGVRGGEFIKIAPIKVTFKKGDATKDEMKIIKKVFTTGRIYYLINNIIKTAADKDIPVDGIYPHLARKKVQ